MRANSHKPGCMRLSPASQSCTVRSPACTSRPNSVWDRPMDNRKVLMASGAGFEAPEGLPRFGWEGMLASAMSDAATVFCNLPEIAISSFDRGAEFAHMHKCIAFALPSGEQLHAAAVHRCALDAFDAVVGLRLDHDFPLAPVPEARRIHRIHGSNICDSRVYVKSYFVGGNPKS